MESKPKRTRQRLEEEPYHSLESARIEYEQAKRDATSSHATAVDTLGSADGSLALRNAYAQQVALQVARVRYLSALKAFTPDRQFAEELVANWQAQMYLRTESDSGYQFAGFVPSPRCPRFLEQFAV